MLRRWRIDWFTRPIKDKFYPIPHQVVTTGEVFTLSATYHYNGDTCKWFHTYVCWKSGIIVGLDMEGVPKWKRGGGATLIKRQILPYRPETLKELWDGAE